MLALVLVTTPVALTVGFAAPAAAASSTDCTAVNHTAFRFDDSTVQAAANDSATNTVSNTQVKVSQATGFVRVYAENPNGYCVDYTVALADQVVSPAELGEIDSVDGNHTAEWHAIYDFERNTTYTKVTFTLKPGEQATFAPSEIKIKTLQWTGTARETAGDWFDTDVSVPFFGDENSTTSKPELAKNVYRFSPSNETDTLSVELKNKSTGASVDEWYAVYRSGGGSDWTPVTQSADNPVYYRQTDGDTVQFTFNENVSVKLVANPSITQKASHTWTKYTAGMDWLDDRFSGLFGTVTPVPAASSLPTHTTNTHPLK